jgi:hypothetical protein
MIPDNPVVITMQAQQNRIVAGLAALDAEVERRMADLTAAAVAGESFIREQHIGELTASVDAELSRLAPLELPGATDPGEDLAAGTQLVLAAYRDLTARYSHLPSPPA